MTALFSAAALIRASAPPGFLPMGDPFAHGLRRANRDALCAEIDQAVSSGMTTGCAMLLAQAGEIVFKEARGDMTLTQLYAVASCTKAVTAARRLVSEPGVWAYSDAAFGVAARCAEVAAAMPFTRFIKEQLFDKVGMRHSWCFASSIASRPERTNETSRFSAE